MPRQGRYFRTLADVADGTAPDIADATVKGEPEREADGTPAGTGKAEDAEKGTEKGADVVMFYSPEDWESNHGERAGQDPDEVVFHELVHVTRDFRGFLRRRAVEGAGFGNEEEYLATTIANMYLSEMGRKLRGAYSEPPNPSPDWDVMKDPDKFYENKDELNPNKEKLDPSPRRLMWQFSRTQSAFYFALAHLPNGNPKFNPVKQYNSEGLGP
jgi:hypothetical protein